MLLNEADLIESDKDNIAIVGVENWGNPPFKQYGDLQKALSGTDASLSKYYYRMTRAIGPKKIIKDTDIALTLSGHTHGMQAAIILKTKNGVR